MRVTLMQFSVKDAHAIIIGQDVRATQSSFEVNPEMFAGPGFWLTSQ